VETLKFLQLLSLPKSINRCEPPLPIFTRRDSKNFENLPAAAAEKLKVRSRRRRRHIENFKKFSAAAADELIGLHI
jgi:hypothetical protein